MNFNNKHLAEAVDHVDACIFTGDCMFDSEDRKEFREFLVRWEKATVDEKWQKPLNEKVLNASNIQKIEWDESNLIIYFQDAKYQYFDIPEKISIELGNAESPGSYLHRKIKGNYRYARIH